MCSGLWGLCPELRAASGCGHSLCQTQGSVGKRNWGKAAAEKAGSQVGRLGELLHQRWQKTSNPPKAFDGLSPWMIRAVSDIAAGRASWLGFTAMLFGRPSVQGRSEGC